MGIDKRKAIKGKFRISENTLFLTSVIGGFMGYLIGMKFFHHKTKKTIFYLVFVLGLLLHFAIFYFLYF